MVKSKNNTINPGIEIQGCDVYIIAETVSIGIIDAILKEANSCTIVTSSLQRIVIYDYLNKKSNWNNKNFKFFFDRKLKSNDFCVNDIKNRRFWGYTINNNLDIESYNVIKNCSYTTLSYGELIKYVEQLQEVERYDIDSIAILKESLSVSIPLYIRDKSTNTKKAPEASGVNWGGQGGNVRKEGPIEAYIPITKSTILRNNYFIPSNGINTGNFTTQKIFVDLIWDDGTIMPACFSGKGSSINGLIYPKQLTSHDGGGAIMGGYFRKRLGVENRQLITYRDFSVYGRDSLTLYQFADDIYYIDFSVI